MRNAAVVALLLVAGCWLIFTSEHLNLASSCIISAIVIAYIGTETKP